MIESEDRVRFTMAADLSSNQTTMTFYQMSDEEGREIVALISRLNAERERRKRQPIVLGLPRPEPKPEPTPAKGNRFSGLDIGLETKP